MKPALQSLFALSILLSSSFAYGDDDPFALKVTKQGDLTLSCDELINEAALMRDIIETTEEQKSETELNGAAVKAAGAVGSLVVGGLTGGLGLAAAGLVAGNRVEQDEQSAEFIQDIAHQRRALLVGIYQSKSCPDHGIDIALRPIEAKSAMDLGRKKLSTLTQDDDDTPYNE